MYPDDEPSSWQYNLVSTEDVGVLAGHPLEPFLSIPASPLCLRLTNGASIVRALQQ